MVLGMAGLKILGFNATELLPQTVIQQPVYVILDTIQLEMEPVLQHRLVEMGILMQEKNATEEQVAK